MRRTAILILGAMICAFALQMGAVLGQQTEAPSQPGTRLSVEQLKQQMFHISAGRRLKPSAWPDGARVAAALYAFALSSEKYCPSFFLSFFCRTRESKAL
jgi:hypothetical protein